MISSSSTSSRPCLGQFRTQFSNTTFPYLKSAQDDLDSNVTDQAKAALITNEASASDTALRAASLASPEGDALAAQEVAAHSRLIDEQVNQDVISAEAGVKLKAAFQQNVSQTAILAKFAKMPPDQQKVFLANFQQNYPAGGALSNPQAGDEAAPLAQRNNNFTNIRDGGFAQGQPGYQGANGGFASFATPEAGLKAADANLQAYAAKGLNTISAIVSHWSPPGKNDTPALIANMAQRTGFGPNDPLDMSNPGTRAALLRGLVQQETGATPFSADQIKGAITGNPTAGVSNDSYDGLVGQMGRIIRQNTLATNAASSAGVSEISAVQKQITSGFDVPASSWQALQSKYAGNPDPAIQNELAITSQIRKSFHGLQGPAAGRDRGADRQCADGDRADGGDAAAGTGADGRE